MQSIERVRTKVHEKTALKRSKNMRTQQDKLNKEKSTMKKNIKDAKEKISIEVATRVKVYSKDLSSYLESVKQCLKHGKDELQKCKQFNEMTKLEASNESPLMTISTELDKALYGNSNADDTDTQNDNTMNNSVPIVEHTHKMPFEIMHELWSNELRYEEGQEMNTSVGGMRLSNNGESRRGSESVLENKE